MGRQEVTVFAILGGVRRYGGQAFFDKCLSIRNRMAASSYEPPADIRTAAFDFSKAAVLGATILLYDGFVFLIVELSYMPSLGEVVSIYLIPIAEEITMRWTSLVPS